MLETEWKSMLSEDTYTKLEKMFNWDWVKEQTNSYYKDSDNILKQLGITLRVRTKDNISKIQVKTHKNADSALQISEESEFDTTIVPEGFSPEDVETYTGVKTAGVSLIGSLTTLRHSLMYCEGVEICLDKNNYLDKTDYEIEIEYTKDIPDKLMQQLKTVGVEFKSNAVGKYSRFITRLMTILSGFE